MGRSVGDRDGGPLRDTENGKPVSVDGFDNGFKIARKPIERNFCDLAIRQARATRVVTNETVLLGQALKQRRRDWTFPVVFKMREPIGSLDECGAVPDSAYAMLILSADREFPVCARRRTTERASPPVLSVPLCCRQSGRLCAGSCARAPAAHRCRQWPCAPH